jgi:sulfide:quinone oxidoreductase
MKRKVVIVGGGNAGSVVANKLAKNTDLEVTVIEPSEYHYYQPGTVDIVGGIGKEEEMIKNTSDILHARWIKDYATKVDVENHTVFLKNGDKIDYDYVVIAAGVKNKKLEGFPEWHTIEGAKLMKTMADNFEGKKIVVGYFGLIKCPAAPFELSFILKQRFPKADITLVNPVAQPPQIQKPMAEILGKIAKEMGVQVIRGFKIKEIDRQNKIIESENGEKINYDLAFIDTPIRASEEFSNLVDNSGLIPVNKETLRFKDYDNVFAIGDITNITIPPKTGAIAHFEANYVVKEIQNDLYGQGKGKFDGSAACAVYNGYGKGAFIYMNYEKSYALGPSSIFFTAKKTFAHIYWLTVEGKLL